LGKFHWLLKRGDNNAEGGRIGREKKERRKERKVTRRKEELKEI
jgi:hypothetical protein